MIVLHDSRIAPGLKNRCLLTSASDGGTPRPHELIDSPRDCPLQGGDDGDDYILGATAVGEEHWILVGNKGDSSDSDEHSVVVKKVNGGSDEVWEEVRGHAHLLPRVPFPSRSMSPSTPATSPHVP